MASESDPGTSPTPEQPAPHGGAANAALGAAGEAVAFFAGAPIAGAADAAIGLEAQLEGAITGHHEPAAAEIGTPARSRSPWLWVVLGVVIVAVLAWLFRS